MSRKQKPRPAMSIGERIKKARNDAGITQESLAETLGVTQGAIHHYEMSGDEIQLSTLKRIAKALGCTVHDIVCK